MTTRRKFLKKTATGGIAGIIAAGIPPAFSQDMKMLKIGQLGLGSHGFVESFIKPPEKYRGKVKCKPYAVWDDVPEAAQALKKRFSFEKIIDDPVELVKESDVVHVEHADYRMVFELAQPALDDLERPYVLLDGFHGIAQKDGPGVGPDAFVGTTLQ